MSYNVKNYTEQGGEKTVIGGEIEILSGATIKADEGATVEGFGGELPVASASTLGGVKIGEGISIASDGKISAAVGSSKYFYVADQSKIELKGEMSSYYYELTLNDGTKAQLSDAADGVIVVWNITGTGFRVSNCILTVLNAGVFCHLVGIGFDQGGGMYEVFYSNGATWSATKITTD